MPLNIPPAPASPPGAAPPPPGPATDAPPGGPPLTGSVALLFGLLLAQTVGQAAPKAPLPLTVTGKGEDKKKDKDKTPAEAMTVPVTLGSPPAPPLSTQTADLPKPSTTPVTGTASATKIVNTGKAMDTVPAPGGELLSPQQKSVPTEVGRVTTGANLPALPHAPVPPATPAPVAQCPVGSDIALPLPTAPASAQPTAPVSPQTKTAAPNAPVPGTAGQHVAAPPVASPPSLPVTVAAQPAVTVAAELAALPPPRNASVGTGLQNKPATADNQPGKNADGKTAGPPPLPAAKATARAVAQAPVGKQAPAVQAVPEKELPPDKPVLSTGREPHPADTAPPAPTPQAAPTAAASQTAATPMPPADRTQMLAQVTHSLETMTPKVGATGPQQVTLQLHPKDWGQLNVRVLMTPTVGADGRVSTQVIAHVVAEHPAVKAALETGQGELRHALREAGLHLDRLTVTVQAPAAGAQTSAGGSRQESRSGETWGGGQSAAFGTTAQGGSNPGGSHPAPSPSFAQGRTGQTTTQADATEWEDLAVPSITTMTGRVDTRA